MVEDGVDGGEEGANSQCGRSGGAGSGRSEFHRGGEYSSHEKQRSEVAAQRSPHGSADGELGREEAEDAAG